MPILFSAGRVRLPSHERNLHLCARAHVSDHLRCVRHAH